MRREYLRERFSSGEFSGFSGSERRSLTSVPHRYIEEAREGDLQRVSHEILLLQLS